MCGAGADAGGSGASGYGRFDIDAFTDRRSTIFYPDDAQLPPSV
jgi:hypothetical protein